MFKVLRFRLVLRINSELLWYRVQCSAFVIINTLILQSCVCVDDGEGDGDVSAECSGAAVWS